MSDPDTRSNGAPSTVDVTRVADTDDVHNCLFDEYPSFTAKPGQVAPTGAQKKKKKDRWCNWWVCDELSSCLSCLFFCHCYRCCCRAGAYLVSDEERGCCI